MRVGPEDAIPGLHTFNLTRWAGCAVIFRARVLVASWASPPARWPAPLARVSSIEYRVAVRRGEGQRILPLGCGLFREVQMSQGLREGGSSPLGDEEVVSRPVKASPNAVATFDAATGLASPQASIPGRKDPRARLSPACGSGLTIAQVQRHRVTGMLQTRARNIELGDRPKLRFLSTSDGRSLSNQARPAARPLNGGRQSR